MTTKQLIEELQRLDPTGNLIVSSLLFAEKVSSYWDGPTCEPERSSRFPNKYTVNFHGPDKIDLHFLSPKDFVYEHLCISNGSKTGELICDKEKYAEQVIEEAQKEYQEKEI